MKTEDQIKADKDAVKAMTGAKTAMEAALRRIDLLETNLRAAQGDLDTLQKGIGKGVYLNMVFYRQTQRVEEVTNVFDFLERRQSSIRSVL